jgi:hypothetical protein
MMSAMRSLTALVVLAAAAAAQERPFPRALLGDALVQRWDFAAGDEGWRAAHDAKIEAVDGELRVVTTGEDPYLRGPRLDTSGDFVVRIRARFDVGGDGQVFFTTRNAAHEAEERSARFAFPRGSWAEVDCALGTVEGLTGLRLDPGAGPGVVAIDWIELRDRPRHPLDLEGLRPGPDGLVAAVHNHGDREIAGIAAGATVERAVDAPAPDGPFATVELRIDAGDLPPLRHLAHPLDAEAPPPQLRLGQGELQLALAADGRGAFVTRGRRLSAALYPLVARDGQALGFDRVDVDADRARLSRTDGVEVELRLGADEIQVRIRAPGPVEGPIVRTPGPQRRALFAGLEFLSAGEASSSNADIETEARWRFAPDPAMVTFPLLAAETEAGLVALRWDPGTARPTFLTPNLVDGDQGVRMGLRGTAIDARITVGPGSLEDAILAATRELPPLPAAPMDEADWQAEALAALAGPLRGEGGFGHCAEPSWPRQPYADHASAFFRLSGGIPAEAAPGRRLAPGGAHQRDDSIYLLTGRAAEWLELRRREAAAIRAEQRADGSFGYAGPYRRGHFEDTSSGLCLQRAALLLEHASLTGDDESRAAGLRALQYAARFRTPRGAQTWELSLHTPDILAAAHGVRAHVLAFEVTGDADWLASARTWALRGLPFVYLGGGDAAYATIAVYGATNWRAPLWLGLPVQWCGAVYAQALAELARHDAEPRWGTVARGILRRAQRMQYRDGPLAGCLPDLFALDGRGGGGPSINPCALVYLAATLDGDPAGLSVAVAASGARVVAPFPVRLDGSRARIAAPDGVRYQVVVDGLRAVDLVGPGEFELDR